MKPFISDSCLKNMHQACEDSENCHCGCHIIYKNSRGKDMEAIINKARKEENALFDNLASKFKSMAEVKA
jgi:hypothetical protein